MAASLTRLIRTLPVPLFGSLNTAAQFTVAKSKALPRMAGWTIPLAIGGLWFVWPAVDDGWKIEMGFKSDPEAAAAAAAQENSAAEKSNESNKITLSEEAMTKVENAYKNHHHSEHTNNTDDDKLLSVAVKTGDYSALEEKWEEFNEKAIRPGEDDDEDEDEEEDEDDEEEEED